MTPEEEQAFISKLINNPSTFSSEFPVKETIGKLCIMWTRTYALEHPDIPLLFYYDQHGCPVGFKEDWTLEQIIRMFKRGPHVSTKESEANRQLHEEAV